jgi:hypothetical protein
MSLTLVMLSPAAGARMYGVDDPPKPVPASGTRGSEKPLYPREIADLSLIAVLVLILTIVRYWQAISWNVR